MKLRTNMIANYVGQGWSAFMALVFSPIYIRLLGIEAYGLIGFFTMLQVWLALLDLGIMPTSVREMARFTSGAVSAQQIRDLLRSFEVICLGLAIAISIVVISASGVIGSQWLKASHLPSATIAHAVALMGIVLASRLGEGFYRSCLVGLQRQVWLNVASGILATLRSVGAVVLLLYVDRSISVFFVWQAIISMLSLAVFGLSTHHIIPKGERTARFSKDALASVGRFAGGMLGINLLATLLTQIDKVLLSRLLPLDQYGYYMLASSVVGAMYTFTSPITQAVYPAMVENFGNGEREKLAWTFHHAAQLVAAVAAPACLSLALFSRPFLFAWSGDATVADAAAPVLMILGFGTLLNCFMQVPYYLVLANGWTSFGIRSNIVALAFIVPALLVFVPKWGVMGAAGVWFGLNTCYVLINAPIMFHYLMKGEQWRWYLKDIAKPTLAALLVLIVARSLPWSANEPRFVQGAIVVLAAGLALVASLATLDGALPFARQCLAWLRDFPRRPASVENGAI